MAQHKLRRVTPGARPAPAGDVPPTVEAVHAEAGLPALGAPTAAEKRGAAVNRRTITRLRRTTTNSALAIESPPAAHRSPEFARIYTGA